LFLLVVEDAVVKRKRKDTPQTRRKTLGNPEKA
jgi:hypothetical protein